jgi:hypothetical protein
MRKLTGILFLVAAAHLSAAVVGTNNSVVDLCREHDNVNVALTTSAGKYLYTGSTFVLYKAAQGKTGKAKKTP